jgi:ribonuclease-3
MKSKIVNRKNLNKLGEDLGLPNFLQKNNGTNLSENIAGNLFEAFVGAIFLDLDYEVCKKIILDKLLTPNEIIKLENKIISYKSLLLEWSQKKKMSIRYETAEELQVNKTILFRCIVWLGDDKIANATESSKKKAEEKAAQRAFYILNKKENILGKAKSI